MNPRQKAFLAAYAQCGIIAEACRLSNVGRASYYRWVRESQQFVEALDDSREQAIESLELVARRRAESKSDLLVMFLLKALRPEKYRDNYSVEHTGPGGAPLSVTVEFVKPAA